LVEHWDGSSWTIDDSATVPGILGGVRAFSPTDVWASGFIIEHWDGSTWSVQGIGPANYLGDLSGTAGDLWAAGYRTVEPIGPVLTLTAHGNGSNWTRHGAVNPLRGSIDDENTFTGITVAGGEAWSVGYFANFDTGVRAHTLVEQWDAASGKWARVRAPNPGGPTRDNELWDVEALSPTDVWAVGTMGDDGSSSNPTLLEHWDGAAWSEAGDRLPGVLVGIAADLPTGDAWAVGYTGASNYQPTLVLQACGV
jgi:hypothetical protein